MPSGLTLAQTVTLSLPPGVSLGITFAGLLTAASS